MFSRRRALRVGAVGAAVAMGLARSVFPEAALGRGPEHAAGRRPVAMYRSGLWLEQAVTEALDGNAGRSVRGHLRSLGFPARASDAAAVDYAWDDGEPVGRNVGLLYDHPSRPDHARVIEILATTGTRRLGLTVWSDNEPDTRRIYTVGAGRVELSVTLVRLGDGSFLARRVNGEEVRIPRPPLRGGKAGLARPSLQTYCVEECTWYCTVVTAFICETILIEVCTWTVLCGPGVSLCLAGCGFFTTVACSIASYEYCSQSCTTNCQILAMTSDRPVAILAP